MQHRPVRASSDETPPHGRTSAAAAEWTRCVPVGGRLPVCVPCSSRSPSCPCTSRMNPNRTAESSPDRHQQSLSDLGTDTPPSRSSLMAPASSAPLMALCSPSRSTATRYITRGAGFLQFHLLCPRSACSLPSLSPNTFLPFLGTREPGRQRDHHVRCVYTVCVCVCVCVCVLC